VFKTIVLLTAAASVASAQKAPTENGVHPVVSPDGSHIAFTSNRDGTPDLYVMNPDGSGTVRLTRNAQNEAISGWSADSRTLFYTVVAGDSAHVYSITANGAGVAALGTFAARSVLVSPDGKSVVYGAGPWATLQLFTARMDGSGSRRLTPGSAGYWCSTLSNDGSRVATSRSDSNGIQISIFDARTDESWQATAFPKSDGNPQCPAWAPDGQHLAFQSASPNPTDPTTRAGHIWIVALDDGHATKLAEHTSSYLDETPSWFPDGKHIAFQSNRTGRWEVWVMNADGSEAHQITD
jgi:TolB protein